MESGDISSEQITASSQYNNNWSPERSRLNYMENGWTPSDDTVREWIQVTNLLFLCLLKRTLRCCHVLWYILEVTGRIKLRHRVSYFREWSKMKFTHGETVFLNLNLTAPLRSCSHLVWILFTHLYHLPARYRGHRMGTKKADMHYLGESASSTVDISYLHLEIWHPAITVCGIRAARCLISWIIFKIFFCSRTVGSWVVFGSIHI